MAWWSSSGLKVQVDAYTFRLHGDLTSLLFSLRIESKLKHWSYIAKWDYILSHTNSLHVGASSVKSDKSSTAASWKGGVLFE
jgi:hypothetical protein